MLYYIREMCDKKTLENSGKTHQGIEGKFSELFVKSGTFSPSVAVGIKNAFNCEM
jgi:hypothetical protein